MTEKHGEQYMEITAESFWKYELELSEVLTNYKKRRHSVIVVPALFCAVQYTKDSCFRPGEDESRERERLSPKGGKCRV